MERSSSVVPQIRVQQPASLHSAINDAGRDPFSFRPVRAAVRSPGTTTEPPAAAAPLPETPRISPPVIVAPFKFMGILQKGSRDRWAIFADCAGYVRAAREGESILGAWTVVRVSAESAEVAALTGQRVTIALAGCGARQD
jgi:hypothetical protein